MESGIRQINSISKTARKIGLGIVFGPILITMAWMVLGPLRDGYSSVSQPISALAIGSDGIYMRSAFLLTGALMMAGVIAVSIAYFADMKLYLRWIATIFLLLPPLGVFWDGIFTMDNLSLHMLGAQIACGPQILTFPVVGLILRRQPGWRQLGTWMAILSAPLMIINLIGFMTSVPLAQMATGGGFYGIWQRALTISGYGWYVAIGLKAYRIGRH